MTHHPQPSCGLNYKCDRLLCRTSLYSKLFQVAHPARVQVIVLLSEGASVSPNGNPTESFESQDFSAQSLLSMIDEIRAQVPDEEWKKLPTDLSKNINHYLYGAPKVEE